VPSPLKNNSEGLAGVFNGESGDDFFYWANIGEGETITLVGETLVNAGETFPSDEDI